MVSTAPLLKGKLIEQAKQIFLNNLMYGYSNWKHTRYRYIAPANQEYLYQWLWDTAFHAIVLSNFDPDWAKREIRNFLLAQGEDGFLPHIIFWGDRRILPHWAYIESNISLQPKTSAITQPPVFPLAVESIYQKDKDMRFLKETLPKLAKNHRWLLANRDNDGDFLISIISPNESGMDELPVFQIVVGIISQDTTRLRYAYRKADFLNHRYKFNSKLILQKDYFNVEELLFNTVFVESSRALSRLFLEIGELFESAFFEDVANKCEKALLVKCWDDTDKIFYSIYSKEEKKARVRTIASLMPLFLDGLQGEQLKNLVEKHLLNPLEFWLPFPVPSVAKNEIYYEPSETPLNKMMKLLWRGPTWINTNWFVVQGLRKHGYDQIAEEIVKRMVETVEKSGFREYYNPETGEGYRRKNFGWSTLLLDLL